MTFDDYTNAIRRIPSLSGLITDLLCDYDGDDVDIDLVHALQRAEKELIEADRIAGAHRARKRVEEWA